MKIFFEGNLKILLLSLSGIFIMTLSYLIHYFDPKEIIGRKAALISPWSLTYKIFQNPPYEIIVKVYIFNITNGDKFISGEDKKLKFEEIGPYTFRERLRNTNTDFHDNGTMSYIPSRTLEFLPEQSISDPKSDVIVIPNVPLLGIASMLHKSSMFLNLAVASIVRYMDSKPILNMTVYDYFWGYEDPLVQAASEILPNWIDFKQFGILDRMFDEGNNTVNVVVDPNRKTGSPLIDEQERGRLYSIMTWNGSPGLAQWGYKKPEGDETGASNSKCNMLEGAYDGSVYPLNIKKEWIFRLYRKFFCRTVPIVYNHTGLTEDGFEGYYYRIQENFLDKYEDNPDNECYCTDKDFCLPRGLGDATPCYYGFPAAVSLPHFLNVDPSVHDKIEGFSPDEAKHGTSVVIHPNVGLLLQGYSRMQTNLVIRRTKYIARTSPFNDMVIPLFWTEMSVPHLPSDVRFLMTILYKVLPPVQITLIYVLGIIGACLITTAGYKVMFTEFSPLERASTSLGVHYSAIRVIPVVRRESLISEMREKEKR